MELIRKVFDSALILKRRTRVDDRGVMTVVSDESIDGFRAKETRIYSMNVKGTFFGIHYRDEEDPMNRVVSVIKGRGMDYLIDLRKNSPTYIKWEKMENSELFPVQPVTTQTIHLIFFTVSSDLKWMIKNVYQR